MASVLDAVDSYLALGFKGNAAIKNVTALLAIFSERTNHATNKLVKTIGERALHHAYQNPTGLVC